MGDGCPGRPCSGGLLGTLVPSLRELNWTFPGPQSELCRAGETEGPQDRLLLQRSFRRGGELSSHSLSSPPGHGEGHKGKFTRAVPPKPILERMLSRFFCASWGQTQRALEQPTLSPISPAPHCGKASSLQ